MTKKDFQDLERITADLRGKGPEGSVVDLFETAVKILAGEDFALAGALALHAYIEPRMTEDLDLVIAGNLAAIEKKLTEADFILGSSFNLNQGQAGPLRMVRFIKFGKILDLMFFEDQGLVQELLKTAQQKTVLGQKLKVLSPDGLALTKFISFRDQDIVDLKKLKPQLNEKYLETWAQKLNIPIDRIPIIFSDYPLTEAILKAPSKSK